MNLTNVKLVLRHLFTHRIFSLINISGLALGMATCILIFLWVQDELGFDRFHENADDLYRVVENQFYAGGEIFPVAVTPGPLAFTLKDDYPEIVNVCRMQGSMTMLVEYEDQSFNQPGLMPASPTFFEMFTFPFLQGDATTALNDLNSIVITSSMAKKYFGDRDPLGEVLRLGGQDEYKVTGVIGEIPANSHLQFNLVIPFLSMARFDSYIESWESNAYYTYVQLQEGTPHQEVSAKITDVIKEYNEGSVTDLYLQPLTRIHLHSDFTADIGGHGEFQYVVLFSVIALIVLAIACINFMNLSTARSANRAKEVGMRKVVGAQRYQIALQFISESIIMVIISFGIALFLVELLLPVFNNLAAKELAVGQLDFGQVMILAGAVLLTGLVAGSYPAIFLSSFQPVQVLRGALSAGARSSTMRKVLVIGQFALATGLIIGALIVHHQLDYIQNKKLGYDRDNLVYFRMGRTVQPNYEVLKQELEQNPGVVAVSRASALPTYLGSSSSGFKWEGKNPDENILIHFAVVGYDYEKTLGLEMATGRFYSREFPSDAAGAIVVNEEAIRVMGLEDPIGQLLTGLGEERSIIGVVKDFHFKSVHNKIEPLVLIWSERFANLVLVKVQGTDLTATMASIESTWDQVNGGTPFEYRFLDEDFDRIYRTEQRVGRIFNYFSFLAIFISCLGLFGLSSFITEQRIKEIGVRKVLGASVTEIAVQFAREFSLWVVIANLIAWPLGWYVMNNWLDNFAYRIGFDLGPFLIAGIGSLTIALVTVSYHSVAGARANPADSLRYE